MSSGTNKLRSISDAPECLKEYLNYLSAIKNRSQLTIINYYSDLKLFFRYLMITYDAVSDDADFDDIDISVIDESLIKNATLNDALGFLYFTINERSNQDKARARKAVALRQFYKYLTNKKNWFKASPMLNLELPSPKNALPKHLSLNESEQLLKQGFADMKDWQDYRDFCMTVFFLNCGMRLSELVSIDCKDIIQNTDFDEQTGEQTVYYSLKVLGKGKKERIVYLNDQCVGALKNYTQLRPDIKGENALFVSKFGKRISNRRVEQIIEARLKLCGLSGKGISVHKLRHTAATLMYQNGVDVRVLKEVLGHENLNTTQIYTHVVNQQMRDAINKNPISEAVEVKELNGDKKND
ncbi:MAG: tyrosine-type recombinase/integrase [Eubacterium sp.]|nr:tyrosine-type recombinase/integrase [Eubacterium sp.]